MNDEQNSIPHKLIYLFLVLAVFGFIDSLYLAIAYYTGTPLSCEIIDGCNEVANSEYSYIAGLSLPTLGIIYYTFTVINVFMFLFKRSNYTVTVLSFLTTLGLLASMYFVYLQLYVIKAVCIYCMFSALVATLLFVISIFIRRHHIRHHA